MIRKVLISLSGILLVGYIVAYLLLHNRQEKSPKPLCEGIEVVIETEPGRSVIIKEEDVLAEIKKMGFKLEGEPIDKINLTGIESVLRKKPIFQNAEVYLNKQSNMLKIRIEQKDPFFRVQTGKEDYYVSYNRGIIPVNTSYHAYTLLFTGKITHDLATGELYNFAQHLSESEYYRHYFGHAYYSPQEGLVLTPRLSSTSVYFGKNANKWNSYLEKLRIFEQSVISHKGWQNIEYLKLYIDPQIIIKEYTHSV